MKRGLWTLLALPVMAILFLASCDKDDDDNDNGNQTNQTDVQFVMMAAMSNYAEIDAGSLAAVKAQSQGIRDFGEMMVTDHTTALAELRGLADSLNLYAPDSLDAAHQLLKDSLNDAVGPTFDSIYIRSQVRDHQAAIALFQNEVNNGRHTMLKEYAQSLLPHLEMHLHHADSLANEP